jgi:hypothetical protein
MAKNKNKNKNKNNQPGQRRAEPVMKKRKRKTGTKNAYISGADTPTGFVDNTFA